MSRFYIQHTANHTNTKAFQEKSFTGNHPYKGSARHSLQTRHPFEVGPSEHEQMTLLKIQAKTVTIFFITASPLFSN